MLGPSHGGKGSVVLVRLGQSSGPMVVALGRDEEVRLGGVCGRRLGERHAWAVQRLRRTARNQERTDNHGVRERNLGRFHHRNSEDRPTDRCHRPVLQMISTIPGRRGMVKADSEQQRRAASERVSVLLDAEHITLQLAFCGPQPQDARFLGDNPYVGETTYLAKMFPNVVIDFTWISWMSRARFRQALREWHRVMSHAARPRNDFDRRACTLRRCNLNRGAPPRLQRCRSFSSASSHRTRAWRQRDRDR